jgi:hypothetical protein
VRWASAGMRVHRPFYGAALMTRQSPHPFEAAMLTRMAAGWRCQACGAEHGRPHPQAPSVRVFLRVLNGEARCQLCHDGEPSEAAR